MSESSQTPGSGDLDLSAADLADMGAEWTSTTLSAEDLLEEVEEVEELDDGYEETLQPDAATAAAPTVEKPEPERPAATAPADDDDDLPSWATVVAGGQADEPLEKPKKTPSRFSSLDAASESDGAKAQSDAAEPDSHPDSDVALPSKRPFEISEGVSHEADAEDTVVGTMLIPPDDELGTNPPEEAAQLPFLVEGEGLLDAEEPLAEHDAEIVDEAADAASADASDDSEFEPESPVELELVHDGELEGDIVQLTELDGTPLTELDDVEEEPTVPGERPKTKPPPDLDSELASGDPMPEEASFADEPNPDTIAAALESSQVPKPTSTPLVVDSSVKGSLLERDEEEAESEYDETVELEEARLSPTAAGTGVAEAAAPPPPPAEAIKPKARTGAPRPTATARSSQPTSEVSRILDEADEAELAAELEAVLEPEDLQPVTEADEVTTPWPGGVVSSIEELNEDTPGDRKAPPPPPTHDEPLEVDELGLEMVFGLGREEELKPVEEASSEPLFRADVIPGGDEDILPFVVPHESSVTVTPEPVIAPRPQRQKPAPPPPWFERFFDNDYLELEPQPSDSMTFREVDFIEASLALAKGGRVLDLCCGTGRHTMELASRGYEVVGIDLSRDLLEQAVEGGRMRKLGADFVHGDVRNLAFRRIFDGVICWGCSFGYFRDAENALVMRKVAQALRPGGRVLIQLPNRDFFLRDLPRSRWRRAADALILDEIDFDWRSSRFRLRRSILRADGRERIDTLDFRGYALHELVELLGSEGFVPLEVSGRISNRGAYFGAESPSLIVLAEVR